MNLAEIPSLTAWDGGILLVLLVSSLGAYRKGLMRSACSLSGLLAAVFAAAWIHAFVTSWLRPSVQVEASVQICSVLAVMIAAYAVFQLGSALARRDAAGGPRALWERGLSAGYGLLRGALITSVALVALTAVVPGGSFARHSVMADYFLDGTHAVSFVVPGSFRRSVPGSDQQVRPLASLLKIRTTDRK